MPAGTFSRRECIFQTPGAGHSRAFVVHANPLQSLRTQSFRVSPKYPAYFARRTRSCWHKSAVLGIYGNCTCWQDGSISDESTRHLFLPVVIEKHWSLCTFPKENILELHVTRTIYSDEQGPKPPKTEQESKQRLVAVSDTGYIADHSSGAYIITPGCRHHPSLKSLSTNDFILV